MDENKRIDLLKTEFTLMQQQVDKFDNLSATIRTWAVTLWAASVGWAFQIDRKEIILVSIIILVIFWFLDGMNKNYRQDYRSRLHVIAVALNTLYKTGKLSEDISSPEFPEHDWQGIFKRMFLLHLGVPYVILIFVSIYIYFQF